MKKYYNVKNKLIPSIMAVTISCSMLIGSTFAWFTDSSSSGVNKIGLNPE